MSPSSLLWSLGRRALVVGETPAAAAVAGALRAGGAQVVRASPQLVDAPEIAEAVLAAEVQMGAGVDILVHAGVAMARQAPETQSIAGWRRSLSADIDGRFLFATEFARRRIERRERGAILLLLPSDRIGLGRVAAATAQGAMDNLVKSLAVEWGRDGLRVNAIASHVVEAYAAATPSQRQSLERLASYLVSDYAAYITGMVMGIDEA